MYIIIISGALYYIYLIIMELADFLSALISGTVWRVRRKRRANVEALSGGCLRLGFPAKACEMKVLRQLAIRYYRAPFLFYGGKRSRLRNSQLIPLLLNSSWEDGATASLL